MAIEKRIFEASTWSGGILAVAGFLTNDNQVMNG